MISICVLFSLFQASQVSYLNMCVDRQINISLKLNPNTTCPVETILRSSAKSKSDLSAQQRSNGAGGDELFFSFHKGPTKYTYTQSCQWEKEMATHSSILAWRIPGTEEPGGLPSMVSHRVGHDSSNLAAAQSHQRGQIKGKTTHQPEYPSCMDQQVSAQEGQGHL